MVVPCATCPTALQNLEDAALVRIARAGDTAAFECLFERHRATYRGLALRILRDADDAEDAVQNACLNIFRKLDTFSGDGPFAAWGYRIARNSSLMLLRKRKRRREVDLGEQPDDVLERQPRRRFDDDPHRNLARREVRHAVARALEQMEPKYRVAIELREFQGRTMEELGEEFGISVGGAKTRLHRARATLRAWLEGDYDIAPDHAS